MPKRRVHVNASKTNDLQFDPRNARLHNPRNKEMIRQSLEEVGPFRSIAIDGDNIIRAGNGVYEQAQVLGLKFKIVDAKPDELIAVRRRDLRGRDAERAALLDNRAGELAEWDRDVLAEIAETDRDLLSRLWDDVELSELLKSAKSTNIEETADPQELVDRAAQLQKKWRVEPGDLWEIPSKMTAGKSHRLLCGDSTNSADVARLMAGAKAALFSTDPPYMVNYTGANRPGGRGKDWSDKYREVKGEDRDRFLSSCFASWMPHLRDNAAWFIWHAAQTHSLYEAALESAGILVSQQIIWVKPIPTMTYSVYGWQHEPCLFGWRKGNKPYVTRGWFKDQSHTTVWVIDFDGKKRMVGNAHPTQKPVEIFTRPIRGHTLQGEICAEPFSGSGTQLVAGEILGRLVYACEITPEFVAVALERLHLLGLEPQRVRLKEKPRLARGAKAKR